MRAPPGAAARNVAMTVAVVAATATSLLSGCFGYNRSAKRWAYVADAVLIAGGGAVIAVDVTRTESPCVPDAMNNGCAYRSPVHGAAIAGAVLAAAGLVGIVLNATRDEVKTSR